MASPFVSLVPLTLQLQTIIIDFKYQEKRGADQERSKLTNKNLPGLPKNIAIGIIVISKIKIAIIIPSFSFSLLATEINK